MKPYFLLIPALFFLTGCHTEEPAPVPEPTPDLEFIRAVDFSFLPEIEEEPTVYYDGSGNPGDALRILQDSGCNMVRIRLWHTPSDGHSGLEEVKMLADRVHSMGMMVWLCVHYSDTWADQGQQQTPAAWQGLELETLKDSVYAYTRKVVERTDPELIQIGNEINSGFLFDEGKISNGDPFYQLLEAGTRAVREVSDCKIMIHFAGTYANGFFQQLKNKGVDYDYVGLSYYPIWHGKDLGAVISDISTLGIATGKKVIIAETSYPFTLGWNDMTHNIVGLEDQILPQYAATPQGQKDYLLKIKSIMRNDAHGLGFCYWGGEWVAFRGPDAADGSSWENQALFDFSNKALPVIGAFSEN